MKAINKFFAIAAIAATSMFSAQNASAAVLTDDDDTSLEYIMPSTCGTTFEQLWGSDWAQFDAMIADNPNRQQIFKEAVELRVGFPLNAFTHDETVKRMESLEALTCPMELIIALLVF